MTTPTPETIPDVRVWRSTANRPGWPGYPERNGQNVTVVGLVDPEKFDRVAVGPMFTVRFTDGVEADAFADEISEHADAQHDDDTQPATVAEFRRALAPGTRWMVTNHYIDRPDHASFGTTERVVDRVTGSHFYLKFIDKPPPRHGTPMPKGGQVKRTTDGAFLLYGGGAAQNPDDLFLTLRPVQATS